jgi:hypothetical protein
MFQSQLISQVVEWERKLEVEDENRKNHRFESFTDFPADPQPSRKESKSNFAEIFKLDNTHQPVSRPYVRKDCREMSAG